MVASYRDSLEKALAPAESRINASPSTSAGDTLVVETTNRRDGSFRGAGQHLHLTERFTRADADTLVYEVTLDDPTTWAQPWTFVVPMAKSQGEIYEYACHEGNYSLTSILSAARQED